jgi:hypothetical protein
MNIIALIHTSLDSLSPVPIYRLRPGELFWTLNRIQKKTCFRVLSNKKIVIVNTDDKFDIDSKLEKILVYRKEFWEKGESY